SPPVVIRTGQSSLAVLNQNSPHPLVSSDHNQGPNHVPSPDRSSSPLPDPGISLRSRPPSTIELSPAPVPNPYPTSALATPPSRQVSVIIPSPDLRPSPLPPPGPEDAEPDLECSICFSQFNNIFRCPKMLQCKHTFCLECLARINVKSAEPDAIQCPLCRSFTPLPALGLPRLATNSDMLSYLPAAMQRVYSIRFLRSKGKLQVKRSSEGRQRWGQRSLTSLQSVNRSLDVGLPSPPVGGHAERSGVGGALFRLTGRPACRAFLLTSVVMMMVLLTGIIIFLLTFRNEDSK
ncbi:E3 ubiquitin-protein ligase RNF183-like, partial [Plectropomus leopardus]|uniref:E3 ubiquitin-protein ligase RNF183-like n=1 Tax=Plectropomus leopardus TaxID=160734 RepID=UPI001C4CC2F9